MQNEFYNAIFKRKSFHLFRNMGRGQLTREELAEIEAAFEGFARLYPQIRTALPSQGSCTRMTAKARS